MKLTYPFLLGLIAATMSFTSLSAATYKIKECNLTQLTQSALGKQLTFATDPAGLAASLKATSTPVDPMQLFQVYATKNRCELYVLSAADLVAGLLKDFKTTDQNMASNKDADDFKGKYLLVSRKKHECTAELGLQLPIKRIKP